MEVSVALAAYNGEQFIERQIDSILNQLEDNDEIIVSVDKSKDMTMKILSDMSSRDSRIKVVLGPSKGVVSNFQNAIKYCKNKYIFLSDQDDIWLPNKVKKILAEFEKDDVDMIMHDAYICNKDLDIINESFFDRRKVKKGIFSNILRNSYMGCCMAVKKDFVDKILPFPKDIPMHDQWIGIMAERYGKVKFVKDKLISHIEHGGNVTSDKHAGVAQMLIWRVNLIKNLLFR